MHKSADYSRDRSLCIAQLFVLWIVFLYFVGPRDAVAIHNIQLAITSNYELDQMIENINEIDMLALK